MNWQGSQRPQGNFHEEGELDQMNALVAAQEWQRIQQHLLSFARTVIQSQGYHSIRQALQDCIERCTNSRAHLWWEPCASNLLPDTAQLIVVSFPPVRYGILALAPGFLVSTRFPTLAQDFANLCAHILLLIEHAEFMKRQMQHLPPLCAQIALSPREREVLVGLAHGYNDKVLAQRLGVEQTTVRTHRQRLYRHLDVHTAQEAVLRGFVLRLFSWLDLSP